jgi:hypothetical protein
MVNFEDVTYKVMFQKFFQFVLDFHTFSENSGKPLSSKIGLILLCEISFSENIFFGMSLREIYVDKKSKFFNVNLQVSNIFA